jgi:hypothetical protein
MLQHLCSLLDADVVTASADATATMGEAVVIAAKPDDLERLAMVGMVGVNEERAAGLEFARLRDELARTDRIADGVPRRDVNRIASLDVSAVVGADPALPIRIQLAALVALGRADATCNVPAMLAAEPARLHPVGAREVGLATLLADLGDLREVAALGARRAKGMG